MRKKHFVFPADHFFSRPPLLSSIVAYLALDIYHAPEWLWGVLGALMAAGWIGWAMLIWQQESKPLPGYGSHKTKE